MGAGVPLPRTARPLSSWKTQPAFITVKMSCIGARVSRSGCTGSQYLLRLHKDSGGVFPRARHFLNRECCVVEGIFHTFCPRGRISCPCCGKGIQACNSKAALKQRAQPWVQFKYKLNTLSRVKCSPLGLSRNQIPSLSGEWS